MTSKRATALRWSLVAAWMLFVWSRSLFDGPDSTAQSNVIVTIVRPLLEALGVRDAALMSFLVRKACHACEYAVLGWLLAWTGRAGDGRRTKLRAWAPLALAVATASIDETIQLFVPGRSGALRDVLIDCCGATVGFVVLRCCAAVRARHSR